MGWLRRLFGPRKRNEMDRWPEIVERGEVNPGKEKETSYTLLESTAGNPISIEVKTRQYCVFCERFNDPEYSDPAFPQGGGYCKSWNGAVGFNDSCKKWRPNKRVRYWLTKDYVQKKTRGYAKPFWYTLIDEAKEPGHLQPAPTRMSATATPPVDRPVHTDDTMSTDRASSLLELVAKLCRYGDGRDILVPQPYYDAVDEIVKLGATAIPTLLEQLGRGQLFALALGKIGSKAAFDALAKELRSPDWRRVEAAAKGLGASGNVATIPILEAAREQAHESRIAEVAYAFTSALAELEKVRAGEKWLQVDRTRPWQQIAMVQERLSELQKDETKRQQAIQWCKEMIAALPELTVQIPGVNFTPADAKSRAWSGLAVTTYYLLNPSKSVINSPCPEAKYCWEQALKLMPGDSYFAGCLKSIS